MEVKFLEKILKRKKVFKKGGLSASPGFFWQFLLLIGFLIIAASCIFGAMLFLEVNKGSVFEVENVDEGKITISKDRIDKVLEYFREREKISSGIISSPSPVIGPSL